MKIGKNMKRLVIAFLMSGMICQSVPMTAFAETVNTSKASVEMTIPEDNEYVSKALVVYSLYMHEKEPMVDTSHVLSQIADVYPDWYTKAVAWAYEEGIVTVNQWNCLSPNGEVSIEEFFEILYRYAEYKGLDYEATSDFSEFEDADAVSAGAVEAMKWAVESKIFLGVEDEGIRYLLPSEKCTVGDLKKSLSRYLDPNGDIPEQELNKWIKIPVSAFLPTADRMAIADGKINGDYGQIAWVISNEGKLTVTGSGNWRSDSSNLRAPWCLSRYRDFIVSAEIKVENMTDVSGLFDKCANIKDIDVSGLDTSQVTNMESMFSGCESLEYLDLSNFDMSKVVVTDMESMFKGCNRLEKIETPLYCEEKILLPSPFSMPNGNVIDCLPQNASISYKITKKSSEIEPTPTATVTEMPEITGTPEVTEIPGITEIPEVTEMPGITETPGVPGDVTKVFIDVHNDWYTTYVQYVFDNNLMTGIKGTDDFRPNANITKAQVAQVLYNMENKPGITDMSVFAELKDVYAGEWYAGAVAWAYNTGIVTGDVNAMKFFPNADVTREQLALMMYRYAKFKEFDVSASGNLAGLKNAENTADWALDGVKWAVGTGLISGVEKDGVKDLQPQGNASRAQMAAILQRFCERF